MKDQLMIYGPLILVAAAGALPAVLAGLEPWQLITLAAILGVAGVILAGIWAWYSLQVRRAELEALTSDDQAARLLGQALGKCGVFVNGPVSQEIWDAFAASPSETKRSLALAVTGLMASEEAPNLYADKIKAIAKSFRGPTTPEPEALTSVEQAAHLLGEAHRSHRGLAR